MDKRQQLLWDFADLLENNHISFCLLFGTLLGAYRDKQFISHDLNDIDIGIANEDYWKVRKIIDRSEFKYKYIWRKEISIYKCKEDLPLHIDIYPLESNANNVNIYSYKVNTKDNNRWTDEWRITIPRGYVFPFSRINFLNRMFYEPYNPERWFESIYGIDWKTPKQYPCTTYDICSTKDLNYHITDNITAIITTYKRPESFYKLYQSIRQYYPNLKVICGVQDNTIISPDKNLQIIQLPEDCGLSYARNELVKHVTTEYTLLLDDDFVFTEKTYIEKLLEVFVANDDINIVSGRLEESGIIKKYERLFFPSNDFLLMSDWDYLNKNKLIDYQTINNINFGYADIVFNFFLAKTDCLKNYKWDNQHKIHSEHLDFFLNLYLKKHKNKKWVAFNPNIIVKHEPIINIDLKLYRERMYYNLIYTKYGIKKGYCIGENAMMNYEENKKETIQ